MAYIISYLIKIKLYSHVLLPTYGTRIELVLLNLNHLKLLSSPATGSPTATLLRLRPDHRPHYQVQLHTTRYMLTENPSNKADFPGVTGGVYKTWSRIHRTIMICDY